MKVGGSSLECFVPGMAVLCQVSYTSWVSEITQLTSVILFDPAFSPDPFWKKHSDFTNLTEVNKYF